MKSLLIADLHFHPHEVFSKTINGINSRLQDCIDFISNIKNRMLSNNIKSLYILGDFFHTRTKIDIELWNTAYEIIGDLHSSGINVYLIAGNHDIYHKYSANVTALKPLAKFANVIIEPTLVKEENTSFIMLPYYERTDDFKNAIASFDYSTIENPVFLIHAEFIGSKKAFLSKDVTKHGIDLSYFPSNYKFILMGHYHMPQKLSDRVMYLGSPLQVSMREIFEDKYFYEFDTEKVTISSTVTSSPRFSVVEYPSDKVLKYCRQVSSVSEAITNNYVEVIAYETIKKNSTFYKLLQNARNVIINNKIKKSKSEQIINPSDIDLSSIDIDSLSEIYANDFPHDVLSKEFLLSLRDQIVSYE